MAGTINWFDCVKWCNARSEMEGRTPAYTVNGTVYRTGRSDPRVNLDGEGYRLPTSTEWEYAARGGLHGRRFPWGNTISHAKANYYGYSSGFSYDLSSGLHPLYYDAAGFHTAPVASFSANRYGLFDMAGNVWEWTTTAASHLSGSFRDKRGGGSAAFPNQCRCGYEGWTRTDINYGGVGFRAVRRR